ncbi:hypothetical protein GCM10009591_06550 [Brachybacterium tyrofermentans]
MRSCRATSGSVFEESFVTSTSAVSVPSGSREVGVRETRSMLTGASAAGGGGADGAADCAGAPAAWAAGAGLDRPPTSTDEARSSAVSSAASTRRTGSGDDGMVTL